MRGFYAPLWSSTLGPAVKILFFPETLYFLQRGSWWKGAPSEPKPAHPEVNGAKGADWPRAPEPSRHTTGWGCRHPPVKCSLPAVFAALFLLFLFSHPALQAGSHWNGKKRVKWRRGEGCVLFQTSWAESSPALKLQKLKMPTDRYVSPKRRRRRRRRRRNRNNGRDGVRDEMEEGRRRRRRRGDEGGVVVVGGPL